MCVLSCILNIMRTLAFYYLFSQECSSLALDVGMYDHTCATKPKTSTEKGPTGSEDEPVLVGVYCSDSSSLILPFPPLFLLSKSSSLLFPPWSLGAGRPTVGACSCDQLFNIGQNLLFSPQCSYLEHGAKWLPHGLFSV